MAEHSPLFGQAEESSRSLCRLEDCRVVAVVGSRPPRRDAPKETWDRWYELERACIAFVSGLPEGTLVISGAVEWIDEGIDQTAERVARSRKLPLWSYRPTKLFGAWRVEVHEWDARGTHLRRLYPDKFLTFAAAAFWRNDRMVEAAEKVAVFWDGASRGSRYTIRKAQAAGKLLP